MQSEVVRAAVPTAADAWTDVGTFTMPAGATKIDAVIVSVAPKMGVAGTVRISTIFRLQGAGLLEQNPHVYVGHAGDAVLGTTGAGTFQMTPQRYDVEIPIQTGGTVVAQCMTTGEVITAGTVSVQLVYDTAPLAAKNSQSDVIVHAMTTTAGVWAAVDSFVVPRMAEGNSPTMIREVVMAVAPDQAAVAVLQCAAYIRLSGAGIAEGGSHEFLATHFGQMAATPGVEAYDRLVVRLPITIPVNAGGTIIVEQRIETETPTAGSVLVGVLYA